MSARWPDRVDHLVYGVPDLAAGAEQIRELTGLTPVVGGRHEARGTANVLLGLGPRCYLEIVGPDPAATAPPSWFGLASLREPRLVTWAVASTDLDDTVATARAAGHDPGEPSAMSRRTAEGGELRWRLTPDTAQTGGGGIVPFLLDWGDTPHPAATGYATWPQLTPIELTVRSPDPAATTATLTLLGLDVVVEAADRPGLRCVLESPNGRVVLE